MISVVGHRSPAPVAGAVADSDSEPGPGPPIQRQAAGSRPPPTVHHDGNLTICIWKPIPVRIFYTFVIYLGYDMDILSGKSYDVIYQGYDMDIPNANNLAFLVIYFLTFGQIF